VTQVLSRQDWDDRRRRIEARPLPVSMAAMVDEAASRWGERPALVFIDGETLSFEHLRRRVNRAANTLRALGVKRGDRVAVMSHGPGAHVIASRTIDLPRPREAMTAEFSELYNELNAWLHPAGEGSRDAA
jgi:non-ribosomal peptide synthetase component F